MIQIRPATESDFESMWPICHAVLASGDTYVLPPTTSPDEARTFWFGRGARCYVAVDGEIVVGMYKIVPNQPGLGSHVANAAYMVDKARGGAGIGMQMGLHSLREARAAGFLAMQFNIVIATNTRAVALWQRLGFSIVGTLPKVFRHASGELVDAYVMHRFLDDVEA